MRVGSEAMGPWSAGETTKGPSAHRRWGSRHGSRACISPGLVVVNLVLVVCWRAKQARPAFRRRPDAGWRRSRERAVLVGTLAEIGRCERAGRGHVTGRIAAVTGRIAALAPRIFGILVACDAYPRESHWQVWSGKGVTPDPFPFPPVARLLRSSSSAYGTEAFQPLEHGIAHRLLQCAPIRGGNDHRHPIPSFCF